MPSVRNILFSSLNKFPYFTKQHLRQYAKRFSMPENTLNSKITRALKKGDIIKLKKNHYVTRTFYDMNKTETSYIFFLANILLKPSYISLESALQYYGLFAEAVNYVVTSVTLKLPRQFQSRGRLYSYRGLDKKLFNDFKNVNDKFTFTIALPHKAIFDYLYYNTKRFTKNVHADVLEELRINVDDIPLSEKKKLKELITQFTSIKIRL